MNEISYDKMWVEDKYWLPLLFEDKEFRGNFVFGDKGISRYFLKELD